MNRGITILFVLLFSVSSLIAQEDMVFKHRLTEIWNHDSGEWQEYHQELRDHFSNGSLRQTISQLWDADEQMWLNVAECVNVVNADSTEKQVTCRSWQDDEWFVDRLQTQFYNNEKKKVATEEKQWNEDEQDYLNFRRDEYGYNADGLYDFYLWNNWNHDTQSWDPHYQTNRSYNGELLNAMVSQEMVDGEWQNKWNKTYFHNADSNITQIMVKNWKEGIGEWTENSEWNYSYEDGLMNEYSRKEMRNNEWVPGNKYEYTHNDDEYLLEKVEYIFKDGEHTPSLRHTYTYESLTGTTSIEELTTADLSNYPNPFIESTTIRFELANSGKAILSLFDLSGKLIKTIAEGDYNPGAHEVQLNRDGMTSGIYIYSLVLDGQLIGKRKMIVSGDAN